MVVNRMKILTMGGYLLDTVLPPRCPVSGEVVDRAAVLSPSIWAGLNFIGAPNCTRCGSPFPYEQQIVDYGNASPYTSGQSPGGIAGKKNETLMRAAVNSAGAELISDKVHERSDSALTCASCHMFSPAYDTARAPVAYDDISRRLVLSYKYGDRQECAGLMARLMFRLIQMERSYSFIIPVPLHRSRLLKRRFNQSALLAQKLAKLYRQAGSHIDHPQYRYDILLRSRRTPSQKNKSSDERRRNVRSAFSVPAARQKEIKGANTLLIDDVLTTGATVNECARILKKKGAGRVDVLTFARTVRD